MTIRKEGPGVTAGLEDETAALSQGMQAASSSWKIPGPILPGEIPEKEKTWQRPWIWPQETPIRLSTFRTVREDIYVAQPQVFCYSSKRELIQKIHKANNSFFEKINKIAKALVRPIKKKKENTN